MLASDLNNTEFAGATDPDARLHVRFYVEPVKNDFKSNLEGRPIYEDVQMVEIRVPGDPLNVIKTAVREDHKQRFPKHWAYFDMTQGKENLEVGTPLSQWPALQPSNIEMLRAMKFSTVEQIASASDEQITRLGMGGGMAPFVLRDKAQRYLAVAKDTSTVDRAAEELEKFKAEAAEKEARQAEEMRLLREQMAAMAAHMQAQPVVERKKPGRKPKAQEEVTQ